jgi:hypothetical protein
MVHHVFPPFVAARWYSTLDMLPHALHPAREATAHLRLQQQPTTTNNFGYKN